ncbi:hypothetical protein LZ198_24230 [Myxococcus sp. K15C18031901]|uniref:hypothetical protein n=1 Tax=Myxococcus dinghuensis TaxID=2906761 RepID=UPI0020A81172|nr:hypothetical protein [Myxococcus dinghuensis]MCP3101978.1 hypothetical protein [Myxococcus dinghuensis]
MTSIRRLSSSILSSLRRTSLDVDTSVSPLTKQEALQPVTKVRRGFADESDFQAEGTDGADALLASLDTDGLDEASPRRDLEHASLRVFSGESSFESAAPRYAQRLGAQLPSSSSAPRESAGALTGAASRRGANVPDAGDILSADDAAWELQRLDTSNSAAVDPEDLLSMLGAPSPSGRAESGLDLDRDFFEDGVESLSAQGADWLPPEVRPAGPEEFLADTSDLGDMVPEEPGPADAAFAGVLGSLAANPVAASVPAVSALSAQGVDVVAQTRQPQDTWAPQADPRRLAAARMLGGPILDDVSPASSDALASEQDARVFER